MIACRRSRTTKAGAAMRAFQPVYNDKFASFATVGNFFSAVECDRIIELGLSLQSGEATIQGDRGQTNTPGGTARQGNVSWIKNEPRSEPLFARLEKIATEINNNSF